MIRIVVEDAVHRTYLFCDHCNKRITDVGSATVLWPVTHGGAKIKTSYPQYAHKSECHGAIEARLHGQGYRMGSDELRTHLRHLQVSLSPEGKTGNVSKSLQQAAPRV
jgi:hypothetical protein